MAQLYCLTLSTRTDFNDFMDETNKSITGISAITHNTSTRKHGHKPQRSGHARQISRSAYEFLRDLVVTWRLAKWFGSKPECHRV